MGGGDAFVHSRVHGPGHGGKLHVPRLPPAGKLDWATPPTSRPAPYARREARQDVQDVGLRQLRRKRRSAQLSKQIDDLSATLPALAGTTRRSTRHRSGGVIKAVRLIVDGKPAPTAVESKVRRRRRAGCKRRLAAR
jgi:hypothetical protein